MKNALKELFRSGSGNRPSQDECVAHPSFTPENPVTPRSAAQQQHAAAQHAWSSQQQQQHAGCQQAAAAAGVSADRPELLGPFGQQQPHYQQAPVAQDQQAAEQQQQQGPQQPPQQDPESSVIAVADHCPAAMLKDHWSLAAFDLRTKLYSGHISSVYRAVDRKSGITVGLKLYKRTMLNDMERHQIAREIWLHIQLNHASVIALYAAWKDRDFIYLVLEWAPEGNVFTFLQQSGGRLPESVVVPMILEPTMSALNYIHQLGMIHRDVKPENILMTTSYQIKLADFGLSISSNYEVANTRLGTIDYLSPEILDCPVKQHPQDHKANPQKWYTAKVDVWSVGVLAYELLVGRTPFEARTPQETLYKIKTQEVSYPSDMSAGAADFIRAALVRDPAQRASLADLLAHPWLRKHMRAPGGATPHMRARAQTQSEVAVLCFPGGGGGGSGGLLAEPRAHASSSSNMRPGPACVSSADGAHNSCPQVLHSQMSAPAGDLAAAALREQQQQQHQHAGAHHQHTPSPLGQPQQQQWQHPQPPACKAGPWPGQAAGAGALGHDGGSGGAHQQDQGCCATAKGGALPGGAAAAAAAAHCYSIPAAPGVVAAGAEGQPMDEDV